MQKKNNLNDIFAVELQMMFLVFNLKKFSYLCLLDKFCRLLFQVHIHISEQT